VPRGRGGGLLPEKKICPHRARLLSTKPACHGARCQWRPSNQTGQGRRVIGHRERTGHSSPGPPGRRGRMEGAPAVRACLTQARRAGALFSGRACTVRRRAFPRTKEGRGGGAGGMVPAQRAPDFSKGRAQPRIGRRSFWRPSTGKALGWGGHEEQPRGFPWLKKGRGARQGGQFSAKALFAIATARSGPWAAPRPPAGRQGGTNTRTFSGGAPAF